MVEQPPPHILYLVHDLSDTTVHKRIAMLKDGGASVAVMGFSRARIIPSDIHGCPVISMGQTYDGKFLHRIAVTILSCLTIYKYRKLFSGADVIISRTLEMLAIARAGQTTQPIVYESLDIHRLLLNKGKIGRIMRGIEKWLCRGVSLIMTSSPAFIEEYFKKIAGLSIPFLLLENKVYDPHGELTQMSGGADAGNNEPWKIGWFGAIRCHKSLDILKNLTREMGDKVEVIIRGKPSLDQFDDFYAHVKDVPNLAFHGAYKNPDDLPDIYGDVHFTWAIDMFEEGLNSSWLLPNRIYEGGLFNAVPIARAGVETGREIMRAGTGIVLDDPLQESVLALFRGMTPEKYSQLKSAARSVPKEKWVMDIKESIALVNMLVQLKKDNEINE